MWSCDSFEIFAEKEQFGLGFVKDTPSLYKYRWSRDKKSGAEGLYEEDRHGKGRRHFPRANARGRIYDDIGSHPLARELENIIGVSLVEGSGYVVQGKIPLRDIKLVGGLEGRPEATDEAPLDMKGRAGEVIRLGVSIDNIFSDGRMLDFQVDWPGTKSFFNATGFFPFTLE